MILYDQIKNVGTPGLHSSCASLPSPRKHGILAPRYKKNDFLSSVLNFIPDGEIFKGLIVINDVSILKLICLFSYFANRQKKWVNSKIGNLPLPLVISFLQPVGCH